MRSRFPFPSEGDLLEAFVVANLAFLGVDILLAHSANGFARGAEWIPVAFSGVASLALVPGLFRPSLRLATRALAFSIGGASVAVGVAGMLLHLRSGFFRSQTLHELVYSAPFIAPLSYVGVGLLLVLSRLEESGTPEWRLWVVLLALGGFVGNFGLSVLDHAQNGFFSPLEWTPVVAAAFGVAFLAVQAFRPRDPVLLRACLAVLAAEAAVGVLGLALHVREDLEQTASRIPDRVLYGAPVFAPLLFTNLSLLAWIGLRGARVDPRCD